MAQMSPVASNTHDVSPPFHSVTSPSATRCTVTKRSKRVWKAKLYLPR